MRQGKVFAIVVLATALPAAGQSRLDARTGYPGAADDSAAVQRFTTEPTTQTIVGGPRRGWPRSPTLPPWVRR